MPREQHRVSDRERDEVAELLREAAGEGRLDLDELDERLEVAFRARTYAELVPLTRDLPADRQRPAPDPAPVHATVPSRLGGRPTSRQSWALMSGSTRRGHWVVPREYLAVSVMGGIDLDLTSATLEAPEVTISVLALMGGVNVIVPPDVRVVVDGFGLMGGFDEGRHDATPPPPGAPVVRVTGIALMGGVTVRRPKPGRRRLGPR